MSAPHQISDLGRDAQYLGARVEQALDHVADVISCQDVDQASEQLSNVYNSNRLRLLGRRSEFHMNLRSARVGNIGLATLAFGSEVEIEQSGDRPFILITTQICGSSRVATPVGAAEGGSGFMVVDTAGQAVHKRFSGDSRRCNVRIEQSVLEAKCAAFLQCPLDRPLHFAPFGNDDGTMQRRWFGLLQMLLGYASSGQRSDPLIRNLEESVLLHLLWEHQHSFSAALRQGTASLAPRHIKRAEDYIRSNPSEALTLEIIAQAVGCSIRSLNDGFRKYRQSTPMDFLRQVRLEGIRAELTRDMRPAGISEVALRWGFSHFGRFSGYYRRRFGELPSDTVRRQR